MSGGVKFLIKYDVLQNTNELKTELQATAMRVTLHRTVSSLYILLHDQIEQNKLKDLLGDFNSNNTISESKEINKRRKLWNNSL